MPQARCQQERIRLKNEISFARGAEDDEREIEAQACGPFSAALLERWQIRAGSGAAPSRGT